MSKFFDLEALKSEFNFKPQKVIPNNAPNAPQFDKPIWQCFCCRDTGLIYPNLVRLFMPEYDYLLDARPICTRCNLSTKWLHLGKSVDLRFSANICEALHREEIKHWDLPWSLPDDATLFKEKMRKLAEAKSIRFRDRTPTEQHFAETNHAAQTALANSLTPTPDTLTELVPTEDAPELVPEQSENTQLNVQVGVN